MGHQRLKIFSLMTILALGLAACGGGAGGDAGDGTDGNTDEGGDVQLFPPTISSVEAVATRNGVAAGSTSGGTAITVRGVALTGVSEVLVGGAAASFQVVSDIVIQATTPPGSEAVTYVRVTNAAGTDVLTDSFAYREPRMWGVQGTFSGAAVWIYRPGQQSVRHGTVGGRSADALAMTDDGRLIAAGYHHFNDVQELFEIDPDVPNQVQSLVPLTFFANPFTIQDMDFVDGRLVGLALTGSGAHYSVEINIQTGAVSLSGGVSDPDIGGEGFAAHSDGTIFLGHEERAVLEGGRIYQMDVNTPGGLANPLQTNLEIGRYFSAMTFLEGTLYAVEWNAAGAERIMSVDLQTGTLAATPWLTDSNLDALASNFR